MAAKEKIDNKEKLWAFVQRQIDEWSKQYEGCCSDDQIARAIVTGYVIKSLYVLATAAA
jgi:hypothetical protein